MSSRIHPSLDAYKLYYAKMLTKDDEAWLRQHLTYCEHCQRFTARAAKLRIEFTTEQLLASREIVH